MRVFSPWTEEEVENLNKRQHLQVVHPYTCGKCGSILKAEITGWYCPVLGCFYYQNWAHSADLKGRLLYEKESYDSWRYS